MSISEISRAVQRRVVLCALGWTRPKDPPFSLGHANILANLQKNNVEVIPRSWPVNHPDFNAREVVDFTMKYADERTDFAVGGFVWNERHLQEILKSLKRARFPGRVIVGGPQVSYLSKGLETYYPHADTFIRGYAEQAMVEVMKDPAKPIKGVHHAGTPDDGSVAELSFEDLPSPFLTEIIEPQSFIRWETQRGCSFRCSFCQHKAPTGALKRRALPISRVELETKWILKHPQISDIAVLDPTFNLGSNYQNVLQLLADGGFQGKISLQTRLELIKPELIDLIDQLRGKGARVVLECGLQTIHELEMECIERPNNMEKIRALLPLLLERNIELEISIIFGLPQQTLSSFQQTVDFCLEQGVPIIHAFPLMLLRGTKMHENKQKFRLEESDEIAHNAIPRQQTDIPHVVSSPSFSYEDWQKMAQIAADLETRNQFFAAKFAAGHSLKISAGGSYLSNPMPHLFRRHAR